MQRFLNSPYCVRRHETPASGFPTPAAAGSSKRMCRSATTNPVFALFPQEENKRWFLVSHDD